MKCLKCKKNIDMEFNLFPYCGERINKSDTDIVETLIGDNNISIGVGKGNTINNVHIGSSTKNNGVEYSHEILRKEQIDEEKIETRMKFLPAISLISAISSIVDISINGIGWVSVVAISIFCMIYYPVFKVKKMIKEKKTKMNSTGFYKEINDDGCLYSYELRAKCPECIDGFIMPQSVFIDNETKVYGFCSNQKYDHIYTLNLKTKQGNKVGDYEKLRINEYLYKLEKKKS